MKPNLKKYIMQDELNNESNIQTAYECLCETCMNKCDDGCVNCEDSTGCCSAFVCCTSPEDCGYNIGDKCCDR